MNQMHQLWEGQAKSHRRDADYWKLVAILAESDGDEHHAQNSHAKAAECRQKAREIEARIDISKATGAE